MGRRQCHLPSELGAGRWAGRSALRSPTSPLALGSVDRPKLAVAPCPLALC